MTKISQYSTDVNITGNDKWIGSDAQNFLITKNFTPNNLASFFNENNVIDIGASIRYRYQTLLPGEAREQGTISFETEIGPQVNFSAITTFLIAKNTLKGNTVTQYLDFLVDGKVLLSKASNINIFGYYKITSIEPWIPNTNFFVVEVDFLAGNGFIYEDLDYLVSLVDKASGSGNAVWGSITGDIENQTDLIDYISSQITTPTLQSVTDEGNTITTEYSVITLGGDYNVSVSNVITPSEIAYISYGGFFANSENYKTEYKSNTINYTDKILDKTLSINYPASVIETNKVQTFQDASGTIALTSDITAPTLSEVLAEGNTTGGENIVINDADAIQLENASTLKKGTYDFGADGGISRICGVGFEDMWQSGIRHVFDSNGLIRNSTNCFDIIPDTSFDNTLRFKIDSLWTLDNGDTYKCTDATTGAAVWVLQGSGTTPTLQEVLDNNHELGNGNNFQGTEAGLDNTGVQVNAFGSSSALSNEGNNVNALGNLAALGNLGNDVNALGKSAAFINSGNDVNGLGFQASYLNGGNNVNALGQSAALSNLGNDVNALGFEAGVDNLGLGNTFNNVNLFGSSATADENGQTVLSKDGTIMARISTTDLTATRKYSLPDASGTIALLSDIPSEGVTSVGLTMPSAFTVTNSPITSSGDIAVTGAGLVSQYVRGDGTLANFPNSTGGGSSVNYYLNGSVSQGTFGGDTYYQISKTPILGAGTNFTRTNGAGNGYIASFITDAGDPSFLNIPGGNWNLEFYFQSSASGGSPQFYGEIYKVSATNVFTLVASGSANPEGITNGTTIDQYFTSISVPQTSLLVTDRLAIRIYVITGGRTITLHTENGNLCEVLTTFTTGLTALNGLTDQVQFFDVGTGATNFNISSSGDTHTFNLLFNIRRNANNSSNNNINYNGYAVTGSAESSAVWTITRLTIAASGSITVATATNVAWTNRESATYT